MLFKIISFVLACACILKAIIGLAFHKKFYLWDRKQYASQKLPKDIFIFILYGIGMFFITWYATIFHYERYGWIITLVVTLSSVKLFSILFNWRKTSEKIVKFIDSGGWKLWMLDITIFIIGILFLLLGLYIYT